MTDHTECIGCRELMAELEKLRECHEIDGECLAINDSFDQGLFQQIEKLKAELEEARSFVLSLVESLEYVVDNFESEDRKEDETLCKKARKFLEK